MANKVSSVSLPKIRPPAEATWRTWLAVAGLVYVLLLSVGLIGGGFKHAFGDDAPRIFAFAANPFAGLLVGIVATALVQSSSTVTSIIVGLVASGSIGLPIAVPMIMGANIGTTITNLLVSLGHMGQRQEFRRAFQAATIHDTFNLLAVAIFLPLELATGLLQHCATGIAELVPTGFGGSGINPIRILTGPVERLLTKPITTLLPQIAAGMVQAAMGVGLIFASISLLGRLLRRVLQGRAERLFHAAVGRGPLTGILAGAIVTVLVQSSSTTTSLIVPMAAAGIMTIHQVLPFTLGANLGTCVTAMLAATAGGDTPELSQAAIGIALVHLFFNVFATLLIYGIPVLRRVPILLSSMLASMAIRNRAAAIAFILCSYFGAPGLVLWLTGAAPHADHSPPTATEEVADP